MKHVAKTNNQQQLHHFANKNW